MQQCIQLTGTNSPFGLIMIQKKLGMNLEGVFFWFGGHSTSETPDSIPNSLVKHRCADCTAS